MRNSRCKLKWEVLTGYQENLFHNEDGQAAEQAVQSQPFEVIKSQLDKALSNLVWPRIFEVRNFDSKSILISNFRQIYETPVSWPNS